MHHSVGICSASIDALYLWICSPTGLPLCDVVESVQLASCAAVFSNQNRGKWKASEWDVAGDGCQEGFHTGAGKPWHAILHKKKIIGLLIVLKGMFHRASSWSCLQPQYKSCVSPVRSDLNTRQMSEKKAVRISSCSFLVFLDYTPPALSLSVICLSPLGGTLFFSQTPQSTKC